MLLRVADKIALAVQHRRALIVVKNKVLLLLSDNVGLAILVLQICAFVRVRLGVD